MVIRTFLTFYRLWHLYESNNEFITKIYSSKTYHTLLNVAEYGHYIHDCKSANTSIPYLLQAAEFTLTPNAAMLYKKLWSISQCLKDPTILSKKMMEIAFIGDMEELEKESRALTIYSPKIVSREPPSPWFSLLQGISYEIGKEYMNYFFIKPSHTPIYDRFTEIQTKYKSYYRSYYQIQFLAVDISDELLLFHRKFQQSVHTSILLYGNSIMLLSDALGYLYGGDKAVFVIEGISQFYI
jgi:hypothetical protein